MSRKETYNPNCKINQLTPINFKEARMSKMNLETSIKERKKSISISKLIIWLALVTSTAMTSSGYFLERGLGKAHLSPHCS